MALRRLRGDALLVLLGIPIGLATLGVVSGFNSPRSVSYVASNQPAPRCYRNDETYFYFYREGGSLILHVVDLQGIKSIKVFNTGGKVLYREERGEGEVLPTLLDRIMPSNVTGAVHLDFIDGKDFPTLVTNFQIPSQYGSLHSQPQQTQFNENCNFYYPLTTLL